MAERRLVARIEEEKETGSFLVRSPAVGVIWETPHPGIYLDPMEGFLTLLILGRRHRVQLPRGVHGRISHLFLEGKSLPVEYDQPICRLRLAADLAEEERAAGRASGAGTASDADDLIAVTSPSEGIFYRRPSPESPNYVDVGSPVSGGTVLGLVEVMKSFNQIVYGSPGLPERGVVAAIQIEDAVEVKYGQPLFLIRPAE
jgi:biotin carboxyl carrier protein